jgi:chromosome segregation protein
MLFCRHGDRRAFLCHRLARADFRRYQRQARRTPSNFGRIRWGFGLYVRRHEAELRLRAADANLARLQDILASLETQLDSLKRQSRQATRYKNISAEIKNLETLLALAEWMMAQEAQSVAMKDLQESESLVAERMATVAQLTRTQTTQSEDIPPLREKQAETAAAWQAQNFGLQRLDDEEQRITSQIDEAKTTLSQIAADRVHETQTTEENVAVLARLEREERDLKLQADADSEINRLSADKATKEEDVGRLQTAYQTTLEQAANLRASRSTLLNQLNQDENRLNALKTRIANLEEQVARKKSEQDGAFPIDDIQGEIASFEQDLTAKQEQMDRARAALDTAQQTLEEERSRFQNSREQLSKTQAEIHALESVLQAGSQQGFRPVLEDVVADEGFEAALSKALGDTIMASTEPDAPVAWSARAAAVFAPAFPSGVSPLTPHIKAPDALRTALSFIGYVEDEQIGETAASSLQPGQSIVSRDGAYWRWDGLRIRAKAMDSNAVRLKNKNRLADLQALLPDQQRVFDTAQAAQQSAQDALAAARQAQQTSEQEYRTAERTLASRRTDLQRATEKRAATESEIVKLEESLSLQREDLQNVEASVATHRTSLQSFDEASLERQNAEVEQHRAALQAAQNALREAATSLEVFQQDISRREARMRAIADERVNLQNRTIRAKERLRQLEERAQAAQEKLEELKNRPGEIQAQRVNLLDNLAQLENAKNDAGDKLAKAESDLSHTNTALKEAENGLMEVRERRAHAQAMLEGSAGSIEVIRQSVLDQFAISPEELWQQSEMTQEKLNAEPIDRLRGKRDRLIRERDGMGPVNLRADVEATEVEQNLTKLIQERNDLTQAIEELRQGIQKLNREARERLMQAFDTVNAHFQNLFTRLFGGGHAHLALIEADDPLEAGLEIFAQPPGKSLQSLSLLSGGEKTLASTALIFAMFLTNPAPICVLDEIDAPLGRCQRRSCLFAARRNHHP